MSDVVDLKPSRAGGQNPPPIADLDALSDSKVPFKFGGKIHYLRPMRTKEFFAATNQLANMDNLRERGSVTAEELVEAYYGLFSSVCETITRDDVLSMTQPQCIALLQLVLDTVTGRAQADIEKKKNEMGLL